jgi:hypothetical protein
MTYIYQWFQFPKFFSVTCPNCHSESRGSELSKKKVINGVEQLFKSEIKDSSFKSLIICTSCSLHKETTISWPKDAFWQFNIHGNILWAWSAAHAEAIANYIDSKNRDEFKSEYAASLFHIPAYFKLAKHREIIVKKIRKELQKNTPK